MAKPKFDPSKPFEAASAGSKPKFDASKPFDEYAPDEGVGVSPAQTAVEQFGGAAALGYGPQIQAMTEPVMERALGLLTGTDVEAAPWSQMVPGSPEYIEARDRNIGRQKRQEEMNPNAALAGKLGGSLAGAAAIPAAGAGAGLGKTLLAAGGIGALQNPGDVEGEAGLQLEERAQGAALGGLLGGAGYGAGKLIQKGVKGIATAPSALKEVAEEKALKQTGAMLKDFRRANNRGQVQNIGRTLLDQSVDVLDDAGNIVGKEKLLKAGDTFDDIAEKVIRKKQNLGQEIGDIYQAVDEKLTDPKLMEKLTPEQAGKLAKATRFDPQADLPVIRAAIEKKLGSKIGGKQVMARVDGILEDISSRGNTMEDALQIKGELDSLINYSKKTQEMPQVQQALVEMRNFIRDKTNNHVDAVSDVFKGDSRFKNLRNLNKTYGALSEAEGIATDRMSREAANRMFSASDYGSGLGGGLIGTMASGGNPLAGAATGAISAGANKLARQYGPGLQARGADALADLIEGSGLPSRARRLAPRTEALPGLLGKTAARGGGK